MNETTTTASSTGSSSTTPDDVWGVNRPPVLPPAMYGAPTGSPSGTAPGTSSNDGPTQLDRGFAALTKAPLRRDTESGVVGGVCAGIARHMGVSPAAVRITAVVLALFLGTGVGAYLIAWALLPDQSGGTHAEQAVRHGRPSSLAIVGLGSIALLGALAWVLSSWPLLLAVAVVAFVVAKKKTGHLSPHAHG